ncbi:hypothetical protein [Empedobacter tilapiae]|uniref:Uncharacterized protein n=1 Tax=Empedobacter tilapiae TaxID=2491114 RepID=A0A4Z1BMU0_9FLAO|nr:hypothetical protein [Empedobacter tilapiae]TGN21951.1 hypothetical protein E4J94_16810 [Empedobacter tilapiae]
MKKLYYKRYFEEDRVEHSENWGACIYYFETNEDGDVLRQIEVYENGKILKYNNELIEDEFGFLADQPLIFNEFEKFSIIKTEFESQWQKCII